MTSLAQVKSTLALRNNLFVPSMDYDLIPPFIMRAGGVAIDDVLKIQFEDPGVDDNCVLFDPSDRRTPF